VLVLETVMKVAAAVAVKAQLVQRQQGQLVMVESALALYNGNIRYNYAGNGYTYDSDADAFIAPRPKCGHKELFLNDVFQWNCQRCDLDAKEAYDAYQL
jgi:hypothetical protein